MALFSSTTKTKKKAKPTAAAPEKAGALPVARNLSGVLRAPLITEKAMRSSERNVYVFDVDRGATKFDVRDAVKQAFGVTPVRVNVVNKTPRQIKSSATRRTKTERGMKKAYVYLKKGDSISLV